MEISFYHLTLQPLNVALPKLLLKVIGANMKAVIKVPSDVQMDDVDQALWTFDKESFLPHDTEKSKFKEDQPIYITTGEDNPNSAEVLVITDGAAASLLDGYTRVLEMFDGNNPTIVEQARERWTTYKEAGHDLTYWQQTETGGWNKKG
ncbi:MAG: DNA polymerase III subunit chi [Kordiimonadaceae bacterium]|jgi:DNA polymerase III subunit chi|nr:DNA polymerase III subunit chi [Kordiimonadaceae bacterium]MBT6036337.1 DNA polymerase III subunit chi [Kordiimonadaceae bacterium]MBT6330028.1 DNA polymerase III subunit chi [Kordiimonadaceae bacterium]MBT7583606.1 DNA polymerase III subunit chi [Kordiimonadaceae bacterium]